MKIVLIIDYKANAMNISTKLGDKNAQIFVEQKKQILVE